MSGILDAKTPSQALAIALAMGDCPDTGDRRHLLAAAFGITPDRLTLLEIEDFTDEVMVRYLAFVDRRRNGEPVSHITQQRYFYNHRFRVTGDVLDPRPETEILVTAALEQPFETVLDLGTGSGAILLSLLAARPDTRGVGTDISPDALRIAQDNADQLGVAARAQLVISDWVDDVEGRFDLIVSNPPYIAAAEMPGLARDLGFEPRIALTDEGDGLSAYRALTAGAGGHLTPGGRLLVEIGWQQGTVVSSLFDQAGFGAIAVLPDLDGRDRVVSGVWPN